MKNIKKRFSRLGDAAFATNIEYATDEAKNTIKVTITEDFWPMKKDRNIYGAVAIPIAKGFE